MSLCLSTLGIVNALGLCKSEVARALFDGTKSGIVERRDLIPGIPAWVGAVDAALPPVPERLRHLDCRNNRMSLAALGQITDEIEAAIARYSAHRIAVILGTSTSGIAEGELAIAHHIEHGSFPPGFLYSRQEPGNLAEFVAEYYWLTGPAYTIHTACSSSGKSFAAAERLIKAGFCDAALVGGVDSLCGLTLNGFHALEALSQRRCNPFSRYRDGTNIGEAAAIFLLEPGDGPVRLLGTGESSDAYHISAPEPSGRGARQAMAAALVAAGLAPDDVAYVNLHGTATPLNDAMEGRAIAEFFGRPVACSSTKGLTGHALGAAAATEAAFLWLTLHPAHSRGVLPPHLWDRAADPEIPPLNLVAPGTPIPAGPMLSNSFAFGGSNVSILLGRES